MQSFKYENYNLEKELNFMRYFFSFLIVLENSCYFELQTEPSTAQPSRISSYRTQPTSETPSWYRAAVYQQVFHAVPEGSTAMDIMLQNVNLYLQQIQLASSQGAEIIVFPEYGITGPNVPTSRDGVKPFLQAVPPNPSTDKWIPCLDETINYNTTILVHLSCAARTFNITTVINIMSIQNCHQWQQECPSDGVLQYNTNIVFNPNGVLIARYDKYHLYGEEAFDQPPMETVTFNATRANVTFGLLTCFDLIWEEPMVSLLKSGVSNIVYPSAWIDGLPFLTSVQIQESRSIGYGINMLAADSPGYPGTFTGGGIYSGYGAIDYIYGNLSEGVLLIANVPSVPTFGEVTQGTSHSPNTPETFTPGFIIYDDLSNYTLSDVFNVNVGGARVCHADGVCCEASYQFSTEETELLDSTGGYQLAAYKGPVTLGGGMYTVNIEVCSILWCLQLGDPNSCSRHPVRSKEFRSFHLSGNFSTSYLFPNVLSAQLQLVNHTTWTFEKLDKADGNYFSVLKTRDEFLQQILVASIYGSNI